MPHMKGGDAKGIQEIITGKTICRYDAVVYNILSGK